MLPSKGKMLEDLNGENHENSENLIVLLQNSSFNNQSINSSGDTSSQKNSSSSSSKASTSKSRDDSNVKLQSLKSTIRERNEIMFNNELLSDVHFVVGVGKNEKRMPAHKYVLAIGSSVFFAMFNGNLAEQKDEIRIPDVEPEAFLTLLKYLYCDTVVLEPDTVLATLYASKKYIVPSLAQACVDYLETSLSYKNACILLSQSRLFEEDDLTLRCWEVIDAQAELALDAESFADIDKNTLESILSRETLNVKETTLFSATHRWATAECARCELELTMTNKRNVLGSSLHLIRIPTMLLKEYADGPAVSDILTNEEIISIFLWYSATIKPQLRFNIEARKGLAPNFCHRFQSSAYRSNQWRYRGRCDSIRFMAQKRIFVAGYSLYGSSTGATNYKARIKLCVNGTTLADEAVSFFSDGSSKTFPVWFRHPIQCEAYEFYTASVVLDGNELSYFGQEGLAEVVCNGVTIQFQCSCDSTNGTGVQGGQIPELIFYRGVH